MTQGMVLYVLLVDLYTTHTGRERDTSGRWLYSHLDQMKEILQNWHHSWAGGEQQFFVEILHALPQSS